MAINNADLYMAERFLRLQNSSGFHSSVSTVWEGQVIIIVWNHMDNSIFEVWPEDAVANEDLDVLYGVVRDNLIGIM